MTNEEKRALANKLAQGLQTIQCAHDLLGQGIERLMVEHRSLLDFTADEMLAGAAVDPDDEGTAPIPLPWSDDKGED
jgi:hypothetical protein